MNSYVVFIGICLMLHILDIITGVLKGFVTGKPSSHTMAQGLAKKGALVSTEAVGYILTWGQKYVDIGRDDTIPICQTICIFIAAMELLSILENVNTTCGGKLDWLLHHVRKSKIAKEVKDNESDDK